MAKGRIDMAEHVKQAHRDAEATFRKDRDGSFNSVKHGNTSGSGGELPVKGVAGKGDTDTGIKGKARGRG